MNIEVGKTYRFDHRRKGKFVAKVLAIDGSDDRILELELIDGSAHYLNQDDAYEGDVITVREQLCTAAEL